ESAEIGGLALEREDRDETIDRGDVDDRRPFAQRRAHREALTDSSERLPKILCAGSSAAVREAAERRAQRVAGAEQHRELLGDDGELGCDAPLPGVRREGDAVLYEYEPQRGWGECEKHRDTRRRAPTR